MTDTVRPGWDGVPRLCQLGRQVVDTGHGEFGWHGKEEEGGREMTAAAAAMTRGPRWQWRRWAARQCLGRWNGPLREETRRLRRQKLQWRGGRIRSIQRRLQCLGGSEEALTPNVKDLEFPPPLTEVWDDLSAPAGWYRLSCVNNLIIQFKDNPINQGLRLVRALLTACNAAGGSPKNAKTGAITAPEDDDNCC